MRKPATSKHLEGISDLVVAAPIRQGFINAFEHITYETRLKLVMDALFKMRSTAREYSLIKPLADSAERIQSLRSFRLSVLNTEPRKTLLLAATFDKPWEPYIRLIWDPLGPMLDVLFCNCEGYVPAADNSFEDYARWVRQNQVDSGFFYASTNLSVGDFQYLSQIERLHREGTGKAVDLAAATMVAEDPIAAARDVRDSRETGLGSHELALEALAGLYRLTSYYPADRPDGDGRYLHRAAHGLLGGWNSSNVPEMMRGPFREALDWFDNGGRRSRDEVHERLSYRPADVQGGILTSYDCRDPDLPVRHGCLMFMRVTDAGKARGFIAQIAPEITTEDTNAPPNGGIHLNLAFTFRGLQNLEVPAGELAKFPKEFQEGAEERAGLIGDVWSNHPRRWRLPARNWKPRADRAAAAAPVELSEVDFVLQLRTSSDYCGHELIADPLNGELDPEHPLSGKLAELAEEAAASGVQLLSVQSMRSASRDPTVARDHFGFADGLSQPVVDPVGAHSPGDRIARGEILLGYANDRGDGPPSQNDYLDNGTFLVVRKMRQDVGALQSFLEAQSERTPGLEPEDLLAKMMGRRRDGTALVPEKGANEFDYSDDPKGQLCPFQSHVRRTNPRTKEHGRPTPRIMRRGLSYGPPFGEAPEAERGIIFMGYNSSIAEQFEVIQRWINGGNSTGVCSSQNDPLIGVGRIGDPRTFRFCHDGKVVRADLDHAGENPFVQLEWSLYLFVPSIAAISTIAQGPKQPASGGAEGSEIIEKLKALGDRAALAWKTCLEDFGAKDPAERALGPALWAAIREKEGGALRVPYGDPSSGEPISHPVLVASKELVRQVYDDPDGLYSVCGQGERMEHSFGRIFIGLDPGPDYDRQSRETNAAIMAVSEKDAFELAYAAADRILEGPLAAAEQFSGARTAKLDLTSRFITPALAEICRYWFGIPDEEDHVEKGGWSWTPADQRKPRCPGDFIAASRYLFYPDPNPAVCAYGQAQGQRLRSAVADLFGKMRREGRRPDGAPLAAAMFDAIDDDDLLARTVIGVMTGFLPPADGNLRGAIYGWTRDQTLWRVQQALASDPGTTPYERADAALRIPLMHAMQTRPAPDMVWRTATKKHKLGNVDVEVGDRIFIGIVSATMEDLANNRTDVFPVFGGNRHAPSYPTHACPGYRFAMGTMMGILSALLEKGTIKTLPAPLTIELTDLRPREAGQPRGRASASP